MGPRIPLAAPFVVRPAPALAQAADRALLLRVAAGAMLLVGLFHFAA